MIVELLVVVKMKEVPISKGLSPPGALPHWVKIAISHLNQVKTLNINSNNKHHNMAT